MSREIKFRAWYKKGFGERMVNDLTPDVWCKQIPSNPDQCLVLMQYTGLKDKNGVEIYEGDIVANAIEITKTKRSGGSVQVIFTGQYTTTVAAVRWNDWWGQWDLMAEGIHQRGRIEVIGNVYENPELLSDISRVPQQRGSAGGV